MYEECGSRRTTEQVTQDNDAKDRRISKYEAAGAKRDVGSPGHDRSAERSLNEKRRGGEGEWERGKKDRQIAA